MSRSLNQVTLVGNLTRDPELRATASGDEVCRFGLALNYSYRSRDGEEINGVDYVDISAWRGLAKIVSDYCHKGKQILVQGRLRSSSWEQDGQTRSKLEVVASNIILLGSGRPDGAGQPAAPSSAQSTSPSKTKKEPADPESTDADYELDPELDVDDIPF